MADQTILRCLQEVDNSRPYFVATIGQRYGWHQDPTDIPDKVLISNFEKADPEYSFFFFMFVLFCFILV